MTMPSSTGACLNRTSVGLKCALTGAGVVPLASLNRTSVGLKFLSGSTSGGGGPRPQSNQRGIEIYKGMTSKIVLTNLNRTSVGLKLLINEVNVTWIIRPQSNQRGIEIHPGGGCRSRGGRASIEPAWD